MRASKAKLALLRWFLRRWTRERRWTDGRVWKNVNKSGRKRKRAQVIKRVAQCTPPIAQLNEKRNEGLCKGGWVKRWVPRKTRQPFHDFYSTHVIVLRSRFFHLREHERPVSHERRLIKARGWRIIMTIGMILRNTGWDEGRGVQGVGGGSFTDNTQRYRWIVKSGSGLAIIFNSINVTGFRSRKHPFPFFCRIVS